MYIICSVLSPPDLFHQVSWRPVDISGDPTHSEQNPLAVLRPGQYRVGDASASWIVAEARTMCSSPPQCAARETPAAAAKRPRARPPPCSGGTFCRQPFRCCPTAAGSCQLAVHRLCRESFQRKPHRLPLLSRTMRQERRIVMMPGSNGPRPRQCHQAGARGIWWRYAQREAYRIPPRGSPLAEARLRRYPHHPLCGACARCVGAYPLYLIPPPRQYRRKESP